MVLPVFYGARYQTSKAPQHAFLLGLETYLAASAAEQTAVPCERQVLNAMSDGQGARGQQGCGHTPHVGPTVAAASGLRGTRQRARACGTEASSPCGSQGSGTSGLPRPVAA